MVKTKDTFIDVCKKFSLIYNAVLQLSSLFGFLLTAYYFFSIRYFPSSDFQSFLFIFLYMTLLSLGVFCILSFSFILAPFIWIKTVLATVETCEWIVGKKNLKTVCLMANDKNLRGYFTKKAFLSILKIYTIVFVYSLVLLFCFFNKFSFLLFCLILSGIACLLVCPIIFPSFKLKYTDHLDVLVEAQSSLPKQKILNLSVLKIFIASIASGTIVFFGIAFISLFLFKNDGIILKMIMTTLIVIFSGLCFYLIEQVKDIKRAMLVASLIVTFICLGYPGAMDNIIKSSMSIFSLGNFQATILVDDFACERLIKQGVAVENPGMSCNV